jgi:hypothetical protein
LPELQSDVPALLVRSFCALISDPRELLVGLPTREPFHFSQVLRGVSGFDYLRLKRISDHSKLLETGKDLNYVVRIEPYSPIREEICVNAINARELLSLEHCRHTLARFQDL